MQQAHHTSSGIFRPVIITIAWCFSPFNNKPNKSSSQTQKNSSSPPPMLRSSSINHLQYQNTKLLRSFISNSSSSSDPSRKFTGQITRARTWEEACLTFNEAMAFVVQKQQQQSSQHATMTHFKVNSLHQYWLRALLRRCGRSNWSTCLSIYSQIQLASAKKSDSNIIISKAVLSSDATRSAICYGTLINWRAALAFALSTPSLIKSELEPHGLSSPFNSLKMPFIITDHHQNQNQNQKRHRHQNNADAASSALPILDTVLRGVSQAGAWDVCLNLFLQSGLQPTLKYKDFVESDDHHHRRNNNNNNRTSDVAVASSSTLVFARIALSTMIALVGYQQHLLMSPSFVTNFDQQQQQQRRDYLGNFLNFTDQLYTSFLREIKQIKLLASNAELGLMQLRLHSSYCFILSQAREGDRALQVCNEAPWEVQENPKESFPTENASSVFNLVTRSLSETRWSIMLKALLAGAEGGDRSGSVDYDDSGNNKNRNRFIHAQNLRKERAGAIAEYVMKLRKEESSKKTPTKSAISVKAKMWERSFCIEAFHQLQFIQNNTSTDAYEVTSPSTSFSTTNSHRHQQTSLVSRLRSSIDLAVDTWFFSVSEPTTNPRQSDLMRMRCSIFLAEALRGASATVWKQYNNDQQQKQQTQFISDDDDQSTPSQQPVTTIEKSDGFSYVAWTAALEAYSSATSDLNNSHSFSTDSSSSSAVSHHIPIITKSDQFRVWLFPILCVIAENPFCPEQIARRAMEKALELLVTLNSLNKNSNSSGSRHNSNNSNNNSAEEISAADKNEVYLSFVKCLMNRASHQQQTHHRCRFLPVPLNHIKKSFYLPKIKEETFKMSSDASSSLFLLSKSGFVMQEGDELGGIATGVGDELITFPNTMSDSDKEKYRQYHSLENFSIPIFNRDAPWVFFSQIALCLELRETPCAHTAELNQRWKFALRAFEKWKTHEMLNHEEKKRGLHEKSTPGFGRERAKVLLDVADLEADANENEDDYNNNFRSYGNGGTAYRFFEQNDISCISTMNSIKRWLRTHGLTSVAEEKLSSKLPPVHHIDEILSYRIAKEISSSNNGGSKLSARDFSRRLLGIDDEDNNNNNEMVERQNIINNDEAERVQLNLLRQTSSATTSTDQQHHQNDVSKLLLQTAVVLRKAQSSAISKKNGIKKTSDDDNETNISVSSSSSTKNQEAPSFAPPHLADTWNSVMLEKAISSGNWQHAHFFFLRSLQHHHTQSKSSMSLQQRCEFVQFELNRQRSVSSSSESLLNTSSPQSSSALQGVALGIIPKLADQKLTKNDKRYLSFAAQVGAESFLACGMWRSSLNFAKSTLALAVNDQRTGTNNTSKKSKKTLFGVDTDDEHIKTLVKALEKQGNIPWSELAKLGNNSSEEEVMKRLLVNEDGRI